MISSFFRRYRDPLLVLLLLLLPFVFYVSNSKSPRNYNVVDRTLVWVSAPIQWVVVSSLDGISHAWHRYIALVNVEKENERLRKTNAKLKGELAAREEQRLENERLRSLLGLRKQSAPVNMVLAQVIGTSPTPLFRSLRIDRGSADGVRLGAGVINYDGVVGRIAAVAKHWSDVILLVDANSSVDILVERTRARARVRGSGGDHDLGIEMQYLSRTADVAPGDILITSGVGSVFPKGLRVGRVVSVKRRAFGLYQKAEAEPSVDFRRIEDVMVLRGGWSHDTNLDKHPQAVAGAEAGEGEPAASEAGRAPHSTHPAGAEPAQPRIAPPAMPQTPAVASPAQAAATAHPSAAAAPSSARPMRRHHPRRATSRGPGKAARAPHSDTDVSPHAVSDTGGGTGGSKPSSSDGTKAVVGSAPTHPPTAAGDAGHTTAPSAPATTRSGDHTAQQEQKTQP